MKENLKIGAPLAAKVAAAGTWRRMELIMKPVNTKKRSASFSYGIGVAKIVAGVPLAFIGLVLAAALSAIPGISGGASAFIMLSIFLGGAILIYTGIFDCRLVENYQRITRVMENRNHETLKSLSEITGQNLTKLVRDIRKMIAKGFWPDATVDIDRGELVLVPDNYPAPVLSDGDMILYETVRPPFTPLALIPAILILFALFHTFGAWYDFVVAGTSSIVACAIAFICAPKVHVIKEKKYKAPPPPEPVAINTGNEALDEFFTVSMGYLNELNELALSVTDEKMLLPVGELLNITRQIFAFVEKNPEKIRQIRGFTNYYLPTTIKLLVSYRDFSHQPLKGENIKESLAKIEGSMDSIVGTFRTELDNLYSDKALDITLDIDMMLSMMRQRDISGGPGGMDKKTEL